MACNTEMCKMLGLPETKRRRKDYERFCMCRPICKNRRRKWKGVVQNSSAENMLDNQPAPECWGTYPYNFVPNGPCPLFGKKVSIKDKKAPKLPTVVRICQAPVVDDVRTPYLDQIELAKKIGVWKPGRDYCPFCECNKCCPCGVGEYQLHDADRVLNRKREMKDFDKRVKTDSSHMRNMYL